MRTNLSQKSQSGLSLVELMVSLVIASVIMAGVVNTLLAGKSAYLYDEEVAYIQENARFGLDYITKEIRRSGYAGGCNVKGGGVANTIKSTSPLADFIKPIPIEGYEGRTGTPSTFPAAFSADVFGTTDAFIVRGANSENALTVISHNGGLAEMDVSPDHTYNTGTVMMMSDADCSQIGIFVNSWTGADSLSHPAGAGASENCTANLTGGFDCSSCCGSNNNYSVGSTVYQFSALAFYVGTSNYDPNSRSLYVESVGDGGAFTSSEIVSGVEDMQVVYGVDLTAGAQPDGIVNSYLRANQITADEASSGTGWIGWDRVVSARVTLVLRSRNPIQTKDTTKTLTTLGTSYTDRYLYQEISTTVNLRNAALPANLVN